MIYPEEFVRKVKELYPKYVQLHDCIDGGDEAVGLFLSVQSCNSISTSDVLQANSLEELKEKAIEQQKKHELYKEWIRLYCDQKR